MEVSQLVTTGPLHHRLGVSRNLGTDLEDNSVREGPVVVACEAAMGEGAILVIDAYGNPDAFAQGILMTRVYGNLVLFGLPLASSFQIATRLAPDCSKAMMASLSLNWCKAQRPLFNL